MITLPNYNLVSVDETKLRSKSVSDSHYIKKLLAHLTWRKGVLKNSIDSITQVLSVDPTIRAKLRLLGITNDPNA